MKILVYVRAGDRDVLESFPVRVRMLQRSEASDQAPTAVEYIDEAVTFRRLLIVLRAVLRREHQERLAIDRSFAYRFVSVIWRRRRPFRCGLGRAVLEVEIVNGIRRSVEVGGEGAGRDGAAHEQQSGYRSDRGDFKGTHRIQRSTIRVTPTQETCRRREVETAICHRLNKDARLGFKLATLSKPSTQEGAADRPRTIC